MSNLISNTERAELTGILNDVFDTFSRNVIIVKAPIQTPIISSSSSDLFGFGESQQVEQYTYTPFSGIFPARIFYATEQDSKLNPEMRANIFQGKASIKVRKDARDFINSGETVQIIIDDRTFILDGDEKKYGFLNTDYYVFSLVNTH